MPYKNRTRRHNKRGGFFQMLTDLTNKAKETAANVSSTLQSGYQNATSSISSSFSSSPSVSPSLPTYSETQPQPHTSGAPYYGGKKQRRTRKVSRKNRKLSKRRKH
jgi:hypothetical protein